jgi:hypothetical protein
MSINQKVEHSVPSPAKRRLRWAGLAALVGCGACCATLPVLSVLGLGGASTAIAGLFGAGTELIVGGAAAALVFAVIALRERGSKKRHSWRAAAGAPIVCTANLRNDGAVQTQVDDYRAAFAHLVGSERFPGGFRWRFGVVPGLEARLRQLADREHGCCGFMSFAVTSSRDQIVWEATADERATAVIEEFFRLPERLRDEPRRGHDAAALKRSAEAAGLRFAADDRRS